MEDEGLPVGVRPVPGALRRRQNPERVAKRVLAFMDEVATPPERRGMVGRGEVVTPLNEGFFALERMRAASAAKRRGKIRKKVRGK